MEAEIIKCEDIQSSGKGVLRYIEERLLDISLKSSNRKFYIAVDMKTYKQIKIEIIDKMGLGYETYLSKHNINDLNLPTIDIKLANDIEANIYVAGPVFWNNTITISQK